tara:strand:- start:13303 stop:13926 length:624 start_codon:yes stop_codon:yes gene_type:complete
MRNYYDIIGNEVINNKNIKSNLKESTTNKYFALYFSAKWCGPCRKFTPILIDFYNDNSNFEVIFVSLDKDINEFNEYFSKMPWKSLPYNINKSEELSNFFSVEGIPSLVLVDNEGNIITKDGKELVQKNDVLKLVVNKNYNFLLIQKVNELIKGQGDDTISEDDVKNILNLLDNKKMTNIDYKTILYILHNYKFTDNAINLFLTKLE